MSDRSFSAHLNGQNIPLGTAGLVRALGPYERMLNHFSKEYPRHFCVVAELSGKKRLDDYRNAFSTIQRRHPMLSVYVKDVLGVGPCYYRSGRQLDIRFVPLIEEGNWRRVAEEELTMPFPVDQAPLMRVSILHATDRVVVILTLHHAIADGLSGAHIIRDLMQALNDGELPQLPVLPSAESIAASIPRRPVQAVMPGQTVNQGPAALPRIADYPVRDQSEEDMSVISTISFDREFTSLARHCSKAKGTTLHGAICAAIVWSSTMRDDQSNFRIMSPINLRKMLGVDGDDCAMLIASGTVQFPLSPPSDFWQIARRATDDLTDARSINGVLASMQKVEALFPAAVESTFSYGQTAALLYDAIVSNLGELAFPSRLGSVRLDAIWAPVISARYANSRAIGAATVNGELHIVESTPPAMPSIVDRLNAVLRRACSGA